MSILSKYKTMTKENSGVIFQEFGSLEYVYVELDGANMHDKNGKETNDFNKAVSAKLLLSNPNNTMEKNEKIMHVYTSYEDAAIGIRKHGLNESCYGIGPLIGKITMEHMSNLSTYNSMQNLAGFFMIDDRITISVNPENAELPDVDLYCPIDRSYYDQNVMDRKEDWIMKNKDYDTIYQSFEEMQFNDENEYLAVMTYIEYLAEHLERVYVIRRSETAKGYQALKYYFAGKADDIIVLPFYGTEEQAIQASNRFHGEVKEFKNENGSVKRLLEQANMVTYNWHSDVGELTPLMNVSEFQKIRNNAQG